jgi:MOSC domain-containing protein YiiM
MSGAGRQPAKSYGTRSGIVTGKVVEIVTTGEAGAPLRSIPEATLEGGKGLVGDRYYQRGGTFSEKLKDSADWELTLIESEEIQHFNEVQSLSLPPASFRRNIVTSGIRLNDLVGRRFSLGRAVLEGVRLCEPCAHLGKLIGSAVVTGMAHRAGIRARIIAGSIVRVGDDIEEDPAAEETLASVPD